VSASAPTIIPPDIAAELALVLQHKPLYIKYANAHVDPITKQPILIWQYIASSAWNESTGNQFATNPKDPSWGVMGLTLAIAKQYGSLTAPPVRSTDKTTWKVAPTYGYDAANPIYIVENNICWGSAFLADLKRKHGKQFPLTDLKTAWVAGYNEGETAETIKHVPDPKYIAGFLTHLKWLCINESLQINDPFENVPDLAEALEALEASTKA